MMSFMNNPLLVVTSGYGWLIGYGVVTGGYWWLQVVMRGYGFMRDPLGLPLDLLGLLRPTP